MGIPFGNLCAGVNINDVTHRAFTTGLVQRPSSTAATAEEAAMKPSLSDAINIQLPYNLERLLFYLTGGNQHDQIKDWYERLEQDDGDEEKDHENSEERGKRGTIDLSLPKLTLPSTESNNLDTWLAELQAEFRSARVTDEELCKIMRDVLDGYGYWVDPHTGVAFAAAQQLGYLENKPHNSSSNAVAIMATASPCKFQKAVTTALGEEKWEEYERNHFPTRGKDLRDKEERPPTIYIADPEKTLEDNQLVWEAKTRALIHKLGR